MPRDKTGHFYFAWFPTIYQQDTQHLNLAECGAYRRLIDHYMLTRAPLPCSDKALARIVGCGLEEWITISEALKAFFKAKDGHLHHSFCEDVIAGDTARILKAQANGSKGGRPRHSKDNEITQPVTEPNPVGLPNQNNHTKTTKTDHIDLDQVNGFLNKFGGGGEVGGGGWFRPSLETCDRLMSIAPGWDQHALVGKYTAWLHGKDRPRNPDAAFLGWAKSFTKGQMPP